MSSIGSVARTRSAGTGSLVCRFRDFSTAEDAVQEAMLAVYQQWPKQGAPENSRACLIQVAFLRSTDHIRSENARRGRSPRYFGMPGPW
jgi:predicted RNA polymerase sigma factor